MWIFRSKIVPQADNVVVAGLCRAGVWNIAVDGGNQ